MALIPNLGVAEKYRTIEVMGVALVGAFIAWVIIFFGYWSNVLFEWDSEQKDFVRNATFLVWLFLILVQAAAWPIVAVVLNAKMREVRTYFHGNYGEIVLSSTLLVLAAIGIAIAGVFGPNLPEWLPGYQAKLMVLSILAILVGLVAAIGIWKAQGALRQLLTDTESAQPNKEQLDHLLHIKDALALFLLSLGVLLSLAIFAASAERQAVEAFGAAQSETFKIEDAFPSHYVVLYGLLFSVLIAFVYAPAHITFLAAGRRFRDKIVPMVEPTASNWQSRLSERRAFEELLELQTATGSNLKAGIAVLSPLLASLTGLVPA